MSKIVLDGKTYDVVGEGAEGKKRVVELRGSRGGKYMFIQNHPNPKAWFLMSMGSPKKVTWFVELPEGGGYVKAGVQW